MNKNIELFVSGATTGTTIGQIDLFGDEPITLNYSITDIKDISKRNSSFSQSFTVPATKNNNILFNHIFNIGSDSTFDPSKKTPSYLMVDSQQVMTGNLQLVKIKVKDKNPISYDVVIYGESIDFVKSLGDKLLTDIDFSELNHVSNTETIVNSWTANTANSGYYYPLIDYGYDIDLILLNPGVPNIIYQSGNVSDGLINGLRDNTKNWAGNAFVDYQVNIITGTGTGQTRTIVSNTGEVLSLLTDWVTIPDITSTYTITKLNINYNARPTDGLKPSFFKPATSNKYLLDKIFSNAGFSYESNFLNSSAFTETIIPYNGPAVIPMDLSVIDYSRFKVSTSSSSTGISVFTPNFNVNNFNPNAFYNNTTKKYTTPINLGMKIGFETTYSFSGTPSSFNDIVVKFYRSSVFGGANPFYEEQVRTDPNTVVNVKYNLRVETPELIDETSLLFTPAIAGEEFRVTLQFNPFDPGVGLIYHTYDPAQPQFVGTSFYNVLIPVSVDGGLIDYNNIIPKKVKQIDYVKSIINMFQLMVIPSKDNPNNLLIEPRQDYFASGETKDWTSKLDLSEGIEETLISEQQSKQIIFSYSPDKDVLNTRYTDDTKKVYGEYTQTIDNEWLDPNSKQEIKIIFSPTPMTNVINVEEIIIPKIGKLNSSGNFGNTDSNIRFLRKNPTLMETNGPSIKMQGYSAQTSYPYAGHLDHPFESNIDYNFGEIEYAFYNTPGFDNLQVITPNNLVQTFWKNHLDYISDKNSKIIKCKIKLTPVDIANFNYNDEIYLEGLTDDGGHYFSVNKITYIPTANVTSVVELVKLNKKNKTALPQITLRKVSNYYFSSLVLGDSKSFSRTSIAVGDGTIIAKNSEGSVAIGINNYIGEYSSNNFVSGVNNIIGDDVIGTSIIGGTNVIVAKSATTATTISNVTLIGVSNYTATTADSNSVVVPNLVFASTGGTINGISVASVVTGGNLWTSGTSGTFSIRAKNDTTTNATGNYAYAEGFNTLAIGDYSHAEGRRTTASGYASHAQGEDSKAIGAYSHAEGSDTTAFGDGSHAEGSYAIASGDTSHAEGVDTIAFGPFSHAEGQYTVSEGFGSHAEGRGTTSFGEYSHSQGRDTISSGITSHAEGTNTQAIGDQSHAEGNLTIASGPNSHSEGLSTKATGDTSHAEGYLTTAGGIYSHAEGSSTIASGDRSHAEGLSTIASGDTSHAEGNATTAGGLNSHSEGGNTRATASYSHSEGLSTTASGAQSHAEGSGSIASGNTSHAEGAGTIAGHSTSHAGGNGSCGQYGIIDFYGTTLSSGLSEIFVGANASSRFSIPVGVCYSYTFRALVRKPSTGEVKEFRGDGLIKNVGGTTSMVGSTNTSSFADAALATATLGVAANNITDAFYVEVNGIAATTLTWSVTFQYYKMIL